jgi:MFS transporter, ACS family, aldohexuronate transporter
MSDPETSSRSKAWRWSVCLLLLAATTINYMDRQLLSSLADRILKELHLNEEQYGNLEFGFGMAFALGSLSFGILADRFNVRYVYPIALLGWSAVGLVTGFSKGYSELLGCRVALGFFEAGHWPCALKTVQRILERKERGMGNSILQSGGATGAIVTPLVISLLLHRGLGWREPFWIVGGAGMLWAVAWLLVVRSEDLLRPPPVEEAAPAPTEEGGLIRHLLTPRFLSLLVMVGLINGTWQLLRAWLPLFLQRGRDYTESDALFFTSAYYIATDIGVLTAGFATLRLARRGVSVHASRCWVFLAGALLALLAHPASVLPQGPALLGLFLLVGAGALAVFPSYYAFVQEVSVRHMGKVNGILGAWAWVSVSMIQKSFGSYVKETKSYDLGIALAGWAPLVSLLVLVLLWNMKPPAPNAERNPA